jgi:hypothetical protein
MTRLRSGSHSPLVNQRRGKYVVDAHPDDPEVKTLVNKGTKTARRGRPRKFADS